MATRPTPFGFFAGCGVTRWSNSIQINTQRAQYHTRLDHLVLHQLAQKILSFPAIQCQLRYFPNSSLYTAHDELRYAEYTLTHQKRDYKLSAVAASESLASVMRYCRTGACLSNIVRHLNETYEATVDEARTYLQELIDSQLLVSELEPAITGEEYLPRLIRWINEASDNNKEDSDALRFGANAVSITEVLSLLRDIDNRLARIKRGTTSVVEQGPKIVALLRSWLPELTESKLFQVDTIFPSLENKSTTKLSTTLPAQLSEALTVLNKLAAPPPLPTLLNRFAERFQVRYEDQEVSLSEALDTETGIDYMNDVPTIFSPLVEELNLPTTDEEQQLVWNKQQQWRWNRLQNAWYHQQLTVELTDHELKDFPANEDDLPPSMSVMFRRVENDRLCLDRVGEVSATNLINRFAHADPNIHQVVQDICWQEQHHNPDVIFAEIVHLPESRVGNIMFHPTSRTYEIPYLATSSVDAEHQLPLSDLYVSVRKGQVMLRSRKLNKRIIPRLSVAHNYLRSELPVYRFLCDLQSQGLRTRLSFSWGMLSDRCKFLPRVVYKHTILHPATWQLDEADFAELKKAETSGDFQSAFRLFCERWRLPRYWVLADGDNELFVDSEQPVTIAAWWDLARKRDHLILKEFFAPAEGAVVNERGEAHAHQLVASWIKQQPTYTGLPNPEVDTNENISRSFAPGSEWLYYKVYCGLSNADRLLEEAIAPVVQQLQNEQKITQWFFIRYADPDTHLRLRFRLKDTACLAEVMQLVKKALLPFEQPRTLSKIQIDTYRRELERYGGTFVTQAEALFHYDSEACLQFLTLTEGDQREGLRWLWALRSTDKLLNDFQLSLPEKFSLLQTMKESFAQEFSMDKALKLQLDRQYRTQRSAISSMLKLQDPTHEFYPLVEILQTRSNSYVDTVNVLCTAQRKGDLPLPLTNLLRSYIHMLINRLMPSQARFHEMVLYDFLYREYRSEIAREKKQAVVR